MLCVPRASPVSQFANPLSFSERVFYLLECLDFTPRWHYRSNFGGGCFFHTIFSTGMNLESLLVCSDDRAIRVLR